MIYARSTFHLLWLAFFQCVNSRSSGLQGLQLKMTKCLLLCLLLQRLPRRLNAFGTHFRLSMCEVWCSVISDTIQATCIAPPMS